MRAIANKDWRFMKYTQPTVMEYALRSFEVAGILLKEVVRLLVGGKPMDVNLPPEIVSGEL